MLIDYVQRPRHCDRDAIIQQTVDLLRISIPHLISTMGMQVQDAFDKLSC